MSEGKRWAESEIVTKSLAEWAAEAQCNGKGIACPDCGCRHWYTKRTTKIAGKIKRERECRHCKHPMTTYEEPESAISSNSDKHWPETT